MMGVVVVAEKEVEEGAEEEEDEADGPVLEDNDEGEEDRGCLLEDN